MANSDKNILITPNINAANGVFPTIRLTGQVNTPVTLSVLDDNSLSFTGSAGQLFSITNSLTGTIFSVNDVSGIPSIEVLDTGIVRLAQYGGNVGVGISLPTQKLHVVGSILSTSQLISTVASGTAPLSVTSTTMVSNLNANLWMGYQLPTFSNWGTNSGINIVVGQLGWKNYQNSHTIFDASQGTAPNGAAISNVDPQITWTGTYPTLMGWNGANTYGVRVELARYAEYDPKRIGITTPALRNISAGTAAASGGQDGDVYIQYV